MDTVNEALVGVLGYQPGEMESYRIPAHLREGLVRYIEEGIPNGSALSAIIADKPLRSVFLMDPETFAGLRGTLGFLSSGAPTICHGSDAKVKAWIALGGLKGYVHRVGGGE